MSPDSPPSQTLELLTLARSYMPSRILLTAFEIGLFNFKSTDEHKAAEIATALGTDTRATETLLDALTALDILTKHEDRYSIREEAREAFTPGHPNYIGDDMGHLCGLWKPWSDLTQVLKTGRAASREPEPGAGTDLALAMKRQARDTAPQIAALLDDGSRLDTVLDLGGGAGCYAIALAQRFPHLGIILYDCDGRALKLAESAIQKVGLGERIDIRKGDILVEDFGNGYDLVFISSVLCTLPEEKVLILLEKVKRSLKPGGKVVIRDHMLDETGTRPPAAALFSVSLLVATRGGRVYADAAIKTWLKQLGFDGAHCIPMPPLSLTIAKKPVAEWRPS